MTGLPKSEFCDRSARRDRSSVSLKLIANAWKRISRVQYCQRVRRYRRGFRAVAMSFINSSTCAGQSSKSKTEVSKS